MGKRREPEFTAAVREALEQEGARELVLSTSGAGKRRYDFIVGEREGRFVFACTPSPGRRAVLNAMAAARRAVRKMLPA